MKLYLLKKIVYPLVPLTIFFFILPDLRETIAIVGNHSTMASIIKNPVNGKLRSNDIEMLKEGEFYLLEDELRKNLDNTYLSYSYTSNDWLYKDSITVFDALIMDIPVFYDARREENKIFPIYAYGSFNIPKDLVDYELGGSEAAFRKLLEMSIAFLIVLAISLLIYRYQNNLYNEVRILKTLEENEYYEYLIAAPECSFQTKVDYLEKYIKNSTIVDRYLTIRETKIKKKSSNSERDVSNHLLSIIGKQIEQEQILNNVSNQGNRFLALAILLQNIEKHRKFKDLSSFEYTVGN